jgi:hypothetical protein
MKRVHTIIFVLLALVTMLFTSAFSSLSETENGAGCNIFLIIQTILTDAQPCGFNRGEMVSLITAYVSDIVKEVAEPSSIITTADFENTVIPTFDVTNTQMPQATKTLTKPQISHTRIGQNELIRVDVTQTKIIPTHTIVVPSSTHTPEPTLAPTETPEPPTSTSEPTSTIEVPQETNTLESLPTIEESILIHTPTPEE